MIVVQIVVNVSGVNDDDSLKMSLSNFVRRCYTPW